MAASRRNILITGASSGLGAGMAKKFAARRRNLVLAARRTERLDSLAEQLRQTYPEIRVLTARLDVNDHEQVFTVFEQMRSALGSLDRVVINAGIGKGQPIGSGRFDANKTTVETNLLAALAQAEAAVDIFRRQQGGHLVVVSSFSALRGLPGTLTAYAASKAGVSALAEGIRAELAGTQIRVTTLLPGYIESEMNARVGRVPLLTKADKGAEALVKAIETEKPRAYVPTWPWAVLSPVMRYAPASLVRKFVP